MSIVKRVVCVSDTDCTKALYFTSLLKFVQEAFEGVLREKYPFVAKMFVQEGLLMPIVSTSAEFFLPIYAGDELEIHLDLEYFNTSFQVKGEIFHRNQLKGVGLIKHVCMDVKSGVGLKSKELFHGLLDT